MKRLPLVIGLAIQLAIGVLAQQPQSSPTPPAEPQKPQQTESDDVVRITTNLVQVDAVITDKNGKYVTDLKPEEVEIYEDGRQQKITHFSYNVAESSGPSTEEKAATRDKNAPIVPPTRLKPDDVRRTIAVVVDDQIGRAHV